MVPADERHQSTALLDAIKEYDANKWKVIGQKVGKPAKVRPSIRQRTSSPFVDISLGLRAVCKGELCGKDLTSV